MKIKNKDLQKLYKAQIIENSYPLRVKCPPLKEIIKFFKSRTSEKQKTKIIDHITSCPSCFQEFEFLLQIFRYEKKLNEKIGNVIKSLKAEELQKNDSILKKNPSIFVPFLSWKYMPLLIGFIIVFTVLIIFHYNEKKELRGQISNPVHLIEPIDSKYPRTNIIFKWNEFKNSDYYVVELFDETLFPIWKSSKILKTNKILPDKISKKLSADKKYFWMITVIFTDGRKIESELEDFVVIN